MPRPTRRFAGLVLGAGLMFAIGTNVQSGWLIVLSSLLLGAALSGAAIPIWMVTGLEVARRAPAEAFQGEEVAVDLELHHRARGAKLSIVVDDAHLTPTRTVVPILRPGERVTLTTRRPAVRRGANELSPVRVWSAAPFGVARAVRTFWVTSPTLVLPAVSRIAAPQLRSLRATSGPALPARPRPGGGPEYLGIREYRPGDSIRQVHWPSTARHGTVMVRELERDPSQRLTVVVDTLGDVGEGRTALDLCCSVAASVAFTSADEGRDLHLVAAQSGVVDSIESADARPLMVWLAGIERGGLVPAADIAATLDRRSDRSVLLVCPTWRANAPDRLPAALERLASSDARVIVALVDAGSFPGDPSAPVLGAGEVELLVARLRDAGVDVRRLAAGEDPAAAFPARRRSGRRTGRTG